MLKHLRKLNNRKGSELIEFVILMPVLLFIVFLGLVFILLAYSKIVVADAAREGARAAALRQESEAVSTQDVGATKAKEVLKNMGLREDLVKEIVVDTPPDLKQENTVKYISLRIVYMQPSIFPLLPQLIGASPWADYFYVSSTAVFKKEKL